MPRRRFLFTTGLSLAATVFASGCQTSQKLQVTQSGAPKFERFRAEYRFGQADELLNRRFAERNADDDGSGLRTVSAETTWAHARLDIECPHPAGDSSLALLKLTMSDRQGPMSFVHKDVRELTIERSEVELLISDLASQNFFATTSSGSGSTQLEIRIDRGKIERSWVNDARLLDLARRTLADGVPATR